LLDFLYTAVSWVLLRWHDLFTAIGLNPAGGSTWALSIFMLVVTIRILLFRFFIKQVHSQRKMQEVQPKIAALREKYKNDRQTLSQEMMKLQKEEGFNPLSGCLPILMQAPVFLALFHVLRVAADPRGLNPLLSYGWNRDEVVQALGARLFGAPIAAAFGTPADRIESLGGTVTATRIVSFALIVLMVAATYITQRQIISRNTQVLDGQQAMIQKLLLYGIPASLLVSGFLFPIGVLLYWFTNNLWTMGQQFYILKRMPHPNAKKDESRPAIDPKLLAPKPGQKPVRPPRRPATGAAAGDSAAPADASPAADDAGTEAGATPNGTAPGAKAADGKAPRRKGTAGAGAPKPPGAGPSGDGQVPGVTADGDGATPDGDKPVPPASRPAKSGGGSGGRPGGGRRPQGQRAPTQTRQKKKRR